MDYSKLDQFEDIGKSLIDGMIFCGCKINFRFYRLRIMKNSEKIVKF